MARPVKADDAKRDFMLRVRFTQTEKQMLLDNAALAGCNASDFARLKLLAAVPRTKKASPERAAFIRGLAELGKVGSNLNQIARALNRRELTGRGEDVPPEQISNVLHGVDTLTRHLQNWFDHGH